MAASLPSRTNTSTSKTGTEQSRGDKSLRSDQQRDGASENAYSGRRRVTLSHTKLVFSDPVAFRYLEEDDSTIVLDRWKRLQGYELCIVEQWVCSRTQPTFVICTYTGDPSHSILVNVLAIPNDENRWSHRLRIYFEAVSQFHAREQETPLGTLMVTNLSSFPSALAVIPVPDGDVKKHREDFIVNENLKRMGCSGRAAMTLQNPPSSTVAKFHHLYHTSEAIDFRKSVLELVKICQTALVLYDKLAIMYTDGLLCDITEKAVSDWWDDIGTEFHNIEPSDVTLGPTTVSALLGLLIGAHNRLKAAGVAVGKDVLDVGSMKRSIGAFQKASKLRRTRRLDRETLDRLHRSTAKTASSDGWTVPRAVKSTVAELSGKGGEMVMGIVGGKDKAGISEVETLDIERLAQLVSGAKMRWLWQGKPLKSSLGNAFGSPSDDETGLVFSRDNQGKFLWTSGGQAAVNANGEAETVNGHESSEGKLGRLRDAVPGLRSHNQRAHKHAEDNLHSAATENTKSARSSKDYQRALDRTRGSATSLVDPPYNDDYHSSKKPALNLALAVSATPPAPLPRNANRLQPVRHLSGTSQAAHRQQLGRALDRRTSNSPGKQRVRAKLKNLREEIQADVYQKFATEFDEQGPESRVLRRSRSALQVHDLEVTAARLEGIPRRLSFSFVEGSALHGISDEVLDNDDRDSNVPLLQHMKMCEAEARELKQLSAKVVDLERTLLPFAEHEMQQVEELDDQSRGHLSELNNIYYSRLDDYQTLQASSRDLMVREKASLNDGVKRIEMLGNKLDYELNTLQSRMQEVEDSATDFERNVLEIEARVARLVAERHGQSSDPRSIPWLQRIINFMGSMK